MVSLSIEDITIDKCFNIHSSKNVALMYVFFSLRTTCDQLVSNSS